MDNSTRDIARAIHGALDYAELARLGLEPEQILDFSVNANPYGPSPHVREAIASVTIERYPDRACRQLRQAIQDYELASTRLPLSALVCGNGANELIWTIARTYLRPGLKAAIIGPTFGEYAVACRATGAAVIEARSQISSQFDSTVLGAWIQKEQPRLVWLCNPNNPTGNWLDRIQIHRIVIACQSVDALLIVDESYLHFLFPPEPYSALELLETMPEAQVIVLRSLTKDFALAAVRLGYLVSSVEIATQLTAQLPAWNVSSIAQVAGCAALTDQTHLKTTLDRLAVEREAFFHALELIGLPMLPSRTHFCLLDVGNAQRVRQELLAHKMLVRDCTSFGLPQFIRVATRSAPEWQQLLRVLKEIV